MVWQDDVRVLGGLYERHQGCDGTLGLFCHMSAPFACSISLLIFIYMYALVLQGRVLQEKISQSELAKLTGHFQIGKKRAQPFSEIGL